MKLSLLLLTLLIFTCCLTGKEEQHPEFKAYFDEYKVKGCFLLYDFQKEKTIIYNPERCSRGFLPASTFKITNTLIGLEKGIITGAEFSIPWDSIQRPIQAWNRDHNVKSAFQYSVVPWYQELAKRIGAEEMQNWVSKTDFGKMDIRKKNIHNFWLEGASRITPFEQLDFQIRLVNADLPFSQEHIKMVKSFMVMEKTATHILHGKTGWAIANKTNIGWLVGYLEKKDAKYAFVINVESDSSNTSTFSKSRTEINRKILNKLSLM